MKKEETIEDKGYSPWGRRKRGFFHDILWNIDVLRVRIQYGYYDIRYFITQILFGGYIKPFTKLTNFDYHSILEFQKFQIEKLLEDVKNGMESDEGRIPKEKDMTRVIELIGNILEEDFMERCGYDNSRVEFGCFKSNDKSDQDLIELKNVHPNKYSQKEYREIADKSIELQKKESKELYRILNENSLSWWT